MDPVTLSIAAQFIATAAQAIQQYSSGAITQAQAHQMLVDAAGGVASAIASFDAASKPGA